VRPDEQAIRGASASDADLVPLTEPIRRVSQTREGELFRLSSPIGGAEDGDLSAAAVPPIEAVHGGPLQEGPGPSIAPHSVLAVPLCARGHCLGVIALAIGEGRSQFGPEEVSLVRDLAGPAAIAIDNARLYRDVQENNRRQNEFLAMLAHELRNPLAPIRSAAEILRMVDIQDPNILWASDVISRQVEHLVRLVDDLLDISRITGGKIQLRL